VPETPIKINTRRANAKLPQTRTGILYEHRSLPETKRKGILNPREHMSKMIAVVTKYREEMERHSEQARLYE
jgi:hypothetical protein